jgi:putative tricarboxylic transport membrane protein
MFVANVLIFVLGYLETKTVVNLLKIPFRILCPIIFILSTIGSYALRNTLMDVWVMILAGIAGYFLRKSGYSVAGIILGVILGKIGESAFVKAIIIIDYNWLGFFTRPVSAIFMIGGIMTLAWNIYSSLKGRARA